MDWNLFNYRLTFASLIFLSLGIFTGITVASLSHIFIFIPSIYFFFKLIQKTTLKDFNISAYFMDLLCLTIVVSVLVNWNEIEKPHNHLIKVKYFLFALLAIFAYKETFKHYLDDKKISFLLYLFIGATTAATISGIIGLYTGFNPLRMDEACHPTRVCGLYGMYMTYGHGIALFMALLSGAIIYFKYFERYINKKILYAAWIVNFLGLYLSFTRGAWLAFLASLPFFFRNNKRKFISAAVISCISLGFSFVFSKQTKKMFLERSSSNNERLAFFKTTLLAFYEKPVWGWGYRNFEPNVKKIKKKYGIEYPDMDGHAHNNFLEHLASTGIIGFMLLILWHFYWAIESFRGRDPISLLSFPFIVCLIVGGMTQYTLGDGENLFLIFNIWTLGQIRNTQ